MDEQSDLRLIREVLQEMFPQACLQAGKANLDDIVIRHGNVQFVPVEGASRMHLAVPLALLASGATVLSHALSIIRHIREWPAKKPPEVASEARRSLSPAIASRLPPEILDRVLINLAQRLPKNSV